MRQKYIPWLFLGPALILLLTTNFYPTIYTLVMSLTNTGPGRSDFVGLANYGRMLQDPQFWDSLRVTAIYVAGVVLGELIVGLALALLLEQSFPLRGLIRALVVLPMSMTPIVMALGWRMMYNSTFGILNYIFYLLGLPTQGWLGDNVLALPSLMIVDIWQWSPFIAFILLSALESMSPEPIESAKIDGANSWQIVRHVKIPALATVASIAVTIRAIDAIKTFEIIYATTQGGPGTSTLTLNIWAFLTGFRWASLGYASAICLMLLFITSTIAMLVLRRTMDDMVQPRRSLFIAIRSRILALGRRSAL